MIFFSWARKKLREFVETGERIQELKASGIKALEDVRSSIKNGELDTHQLAAVTECLDSMSVRLEKQTDKIGKGKA